MLFGVVHYAQKYLWFSISLAPVFQVAGGCIVMKELLVLHGAISRSKDRGDNMHVETKPGRREACMRMYVAVSCC